MLFCTWVAVAAGVVKVGVGTAVASRRRLMQSGEVKNVIAVAERGVWRLWRFEVWGLLGVGVVWG